MPRTPQGHHTVSAYLSCKGAAAAISFYADVFGAVEVGQRYVDQSDGRIGHAEFQINDTRMMIADEYPEVGSVSPLTLGGSPVSFAIYVDDVDAVYQHALDLGATGQRPPEDQPYGARAAWLLDPWGHRWTVQTLLDQPATSFDGFDLIDVTHTSSPTETQKP
jgi:PhnB protein